MMVVLQRQKSRNGDAVALKCGNLPGTKVSKVEP